MTFEEMLGEVRTQSDAISERRIMNEQIKWWLYSGFKDFCIKTECSQQAADYTTTTDEDSEWYTAYPLPGYEYELTGGEPYPYSYTAYAGSTFKRALRLYIDGVMAEYTSIDRIAEPTGSLTPTMGTDLQGESIPGNIFSGEADDTSRQYWYIQYNKFWCPYPQVQESVPCRLHYIWVPDKNFKTSIEYPVGNDSRIEVASKIPAIWHDAIVSYALMKLFQSLGREHMQAKLDYQREYNDYVAQAQKQFRGLGITAGIRGNYF